MNLEKKKELAKVGMSATLLATVATSMFMKKKFAKKTHIVCGVALCGFELWHHMLYDKPKQKRVVHVQDEKIEAKV